MSNLLTHMKRVCQRLARELAHATRRLVARIKSAWERHQALMNDRDAYRAQVAAGLAAVVAAFEIDPRITAVLLALFGLHAAAFGHRPQPLRGRTYLDDDDGRWDPFS